VQLAYGRCCGLEEHEASTTAYVLVLGETASGRLGVPAR
jgi:hypothetical protein